MQLEQAARAVYLTHNHFGIGQQGKWVDGPGSALHGEDSERLTAKAAISLEATARASRRVPMRCVRQIPTIVKFSSLPYSQAAPGYHQEMRANGLGEGRHVVSLV